MNGWVKLHRKLLDWEWYTTENMVHLFLHLLLSANHEKKRWKGIEIEAGQLATGRVSLSENTGISIQSIRTCLERLKSTNEITIKTTNRFSIITVVKWNSYQLDIDVSNQPNNQQANQQLTNNQPTTNHKQEIKNIKNEKNIKEYATFFETFWNSYPSRNGKKVGKKEAFNLLKNLKLENGNRELLLKAVENYSQSKSVLDGFAKDAVRFIKKDFWRDWIEPAEEEKGGGFSDW